MGLLLLVVLTQALVLSADTFLYPFFPEIALAKGISRTYIGIVFSAYKLARFATSPIAGSLVSKVTPKVMAVIGGWSDEHFLCGFGLTLLHR
ncbi:hypothetical protein EB796_005712 [Bugula neritina]|uniref:SLC18B1 n=1 Tax=Bugula neritina TaxID=10212 RepID=A0A7J7KBF9_BUGNE|nr:hypothetical protein EB796_005712 [Bugula neritina]